VCERVGMREGVYEDERRCVSWTAGLNSAMLCVYTVCVYTVCVYTVCVYTVCVYTVCVYTGSSRCGSLFPHDVNV
jgi:hypothetical protein